MYIEVVEDLSMQMKVLEEQLQNSFTSQDQLANYLKVIKTHLAEPSSDRQKFLRKLAEQDKII